VSGMVSRSCQATATFVSTEPGNVEINTKNQQGLRNTTQRKSVCDSTNVSSFVVSADREQAPADGATPISLYVWFQDSQGKPTHGNQSKFLGIDPTGVGFRLTSTGGEVPIGPSIVSETECSYAESRASDSAGVAAIRFSFRSQSEFKRFYFYPPLSFRVLVWAALGGLACVFVRIVHTHKRKALGYYVTQPLTGVIAAIGIYLFFYYGIAPLARKSFPSGAGMAFLLGLVGGYLGVRTLDLIARYFSALTRFRRRKKDSEKTNLPVSDLRT